jgi:hypothetical protein
LDQPCVGWDRVTFFDEDDVARNDISGRNVLPLTATNHIGVRGGHQSQRCHGLLRARLLNVTHDGVQQHHGENCDRLVRQGRFALIKPESG